MQQILQKLDLAAPSSTDTTFSDVNQRGHALRLSVAGALDIATADSLSNVAIRALHLPVRVLVLDIYGVTFCGAAGVSALFEILDAASNTGTRLVLTGVQPPVRSVFDLVGLNRMIPILARREELCTAANRQTSNGGQAARPEMNQPGSSRAA